jgi:hypothetical protein
MFDDSRLAAPRPARATAATARDGMARQPTRLSKVFMKLSVSARVHLANLALRPVVVGAVDN